MATETFSYTGDVQSWTVPSNVTAIRIQCYGAGGEDGGGDGFGTGASGGYAEGYLDVSPGDTLNFYAGGQGNSSGAFPTGGPGVDGYSDSYGGGGGGSSEVRYGGTALSDRVIVAGGGGGGAGIHYNDSGDHGAGNGGSGGGNAADGQDNSYSDDDGGAGGGASGAQGEEGHDGSDTTNYAAGAVGGSGGGGANGGAGGGASASGGSGDDDAEAGGGGGGDGMVAGVRDASMSRGGNAGDGEVVITYYTPPTMDSIDESVDRQLTIHWTNEDTYDEIEIYRYVASFQTPEYVDTVSGSVTSYTDTDIPDGTGYYYEVEGVVNGEGTGRSGNIYGETNMPAPENVTVDATDHTTATLSWDEPYNNGQTLISYRTADGGDWQSGPIEDLGAEGTTVTDLLNGEEYEFQVESNTSAVQSTAPLVTGTTTLPDASPPSLDVSTEDQLFIDWPVVTNNGGVRIDYRRTGESTWIHESTFSHDLTGLTIYGVDDGEEYEVRIRTQTDHRTGSWTDPVSAVTLLPAPSNVSISGLTTTSATISWSDDSDYEGGFDVERAKEYDDGWGPWETVAELPPDTSSYEEDDSLQPGTTYRWRVRTYTEHTEEYSSNVSTTTTSLDVPQRHRTRSEGWMVEVEGDTGAFHRPTVLEKETDWRARLNDQPRVDVAVPKSEVWETEDIEGQPMRVWKDGVELPIDEVLSTRREAGYDVIEGIGGVELEQDVSVLEYPEEDAHVAAEDAVTTHTTYAFDGDDPSTEAREDVQLRSVGWGDDWENYTQDEITTETSPLYTFGGSVQCDPTGQFIEGEDRDTGGFVYFADQEGRDGEWSGGQALRLAPGESAEFSWSELNHVVPEGEAYFTMCYALPESPTPSLTWEIDVFGGGTHEIDTVNEGALIQADDQFDMSTFDFPLNGSYSDYNGSLDSLSHTVIITNESSSSTAAYIDFVHFRDDRYSYNMGDYNTTNGVVSGWEAYPPSIDLVFNPISSVEQVVGGEINVDMDDTTGDQQLALRNDTAGTWQTASNTTEYDVDFANPSQLLQARIRLSRYDSTGDMSGNFGDEFQSVDQANLYADLVNTPVLLDFVHEGEFKNGLNRIADAGDYIWELRRINGQDTIVWTQPGIRVASGDPGVIDYSGRRTTERSYQHVIARGKSRTVEGETFSLHAYDSATGLSEGPPLIPGKETVYDSSGTVYERGLDYQMVYDIGAIEIFEGGNMETDTDYLIDYSWRYEGEYTDPDADDPDTLRLDFPDASSDRECEQLAHAVVREISEPLEEAQVTIESIDPTEPLTEVVDPEELDLEGPLRQREIDTQPGRIVQSLGSRRNTSDIVSDLRERVSALARNI